MEKEPVGQDKITKQKSTVWIKGSGSTGCLLSHGLQDSPDFIHLKIPFRLNKLALSGSFILCTDYEDRAYIWGTLETEIIKQPKFIKENVCRISCGWNHALLQCQDGIWGIGSNAYSELGSESQDKYLKHAAKVRQGKVDHFICGFRQSYMVVNDEILGCGESKKYELGMADKKQYFRWQTVYSGLQERLKSKISQLAIGKRYLLMLTDKGEVWAFGNNQQNVFNNKQIVYFSTPTIIFEGVKAVVSGWAHIALLNSKGKLYSYGRNNLNQLGRKQKEEVQLPLEQNESIERVVSGSQYSFIITNKNRVFGWGWNEHLNIIPEPIYALEKPTQVQMPGKCLELWTYPAILVAKCM